MKGGQFPVKRGGHHSLETRERLRAAQRRNWANPERCAEHGAFIKHRMARPGVSERISVRTTLAMADPAVRARIREGMARAARAADTRKKINVPAPSEMANR